MPSNEQADEPPERSSNYLATLVGAAIAVLTLTIPLYFIASYSSGSFSGNPSPQFQALPPRPVR